MVNCVVWSTEALCLLYKIYHRVDHPLNEYLYHFVALRNTKASAVLGELALVSPRCWADQVTRPFLPAAVRLLNLMTSGVFSGVSVEPAAIGRV